MSRASACGWCGGLSNSPAVVIARFFLLALSSLVLCCMLLFSQPLLAQQQAEAEFYDSDLARIHQFYQALLDAHLSPGEQFGLPANMIDYAAIRSDTRLEALVELIQDYPKARLDSVDKQLAFYLNAYNILAIAKVAKHWPLQKLKSLGSFYRPVWTHYAGEVCGEKMTLRKLEHDVLRKLGDPRIHFALNCASMSCPDLREEPYLAERIEQQLEEQTRRFLAQAGKGMAYVEGGVVLSPIFDWFKEDFDMAGGVKAFLQPYLATIAPGWRIVDYYEYNWHVNDILSGAEKQRIKRGSNTWFN